MDSWMSARIRVAITLLGVLALPCSPAATAADEAAAPAPAPGAAPSLVIFPGILMDGSHPVWDVLGLQLRLEPRAGAAQIAALRRAKPAPDAGQEILTRWDNLTQLRGQFAGKPMRDASSYWIHRTVTADGQQPGEASFVYQLTYYTTTIAVQGEVLRAGPQLPQMFHVSDK